MRATPEVYQGEVYGWSYRIFKNDTGHWVGFRWDRRWVSYITHEWFCEDGFTKDRSIKSNDDRLARFDTAEECEGELLMIIAADKISE